MNREVKKEVLLELSKEKNYYPPKNGNSYAENVPENAPLWHPDNVIDPYKIRKSSSIKVGWICRECQFEWISSINNIQKGNRCPACNSQGHTIEGVNTLDNAYPEVWKWWSNKNKEQPDQVSRGTKKKYIFKCPNCSKEFSRRPFRFDFSCPYCIQRKNSLGTKCPEIAQQLHGQDKEHMYEISYNSAKVVKWECEKGHIWESTVYQRVNSKSGCPACYSITKISKEHLEIHNIISSKYPDFSIKDCDTNIISPREIDILIEDVQIGIEYNGTFWHSTERVTNTLKHQNKWKECMSRNIHLITIWEHDWYTSKDIVLNRIFNEIESSLGKGRELDFLLESTDECEFNSNLTFTSKNTSDTFKVTIDKHLKTAFIGISGNKLSSQEKSQVCNSVIIPELKKRNIEHLQWELDLNFETPIPFLAQENCRFHTTPPALKHVGKLNIKTPQDPQKFNKTYEIYDCGIGVLDFNLNQHV